MCPRASFGSAPLHNLSVRRAVLVQTVKRAADTCDVAHGEIIFVAERLEGADPHPPDQRRIRTRLRFAERGSILFRYIIYSII